MPAVDTRDLVLPLQLLTHVRPGDPWHFAGELMPFKVLSVDDVTGLVRLERDWHGVTYAEWLQERAGVSRRLCDHGGVECDRCPGFAPKGGVKRG